MAKPKKLTIVVPFRWIANPVFETRSGKTVVFGHDGRNRVGPHKLTPSQKSQVEGLLNRTLHKHEWSSLEKIRVGYVRDRHTWNEALTEKEIGKYYLDFLGAVKSTLRACGKANVRREAAATAMWSAIETYGGLEEYKRRYAYLQERRPPSMAELCEVPLSLHFFVRMLEAILERGVAARPAYLQLRKAKRLDTFGRLIGSLKFIFETDGAVATAAKSSRAKAPKPSAFVLFVWHFMEMLPKEIREHTHSMSAMEKAVSSQLKAWRRLGSQSGRTDYYLC